MDRWPVDRFTFEDEYRVRRLSCRLKRPMNQILVDAVRAYYDTLCPGEPALPKYLQDACEQIDAVKEAEQQEAAKARLAAMQQHKQGVIF
jgi:hypothetical protein